MSCISLGTFQMHPYSISHTSGWQMKLYSSSGQGNLLSWDVVDGNLLQHSVGVQLRWHDILQSNFVSGQEVVLDGMPFLCRIPHIGTDQEPCIQHPWIYDFWAIQEYSEKNCLLAGDGCSIIDPKEEHTQAHIRLLLEPHCPDLNEMVGKIVRLLLPTGIFQAKMIEAGEYDLTCTDLELITGYASPNWLLWKKAKSYITQSAVINAATIE